MTTGANTMSERDKFEAAVKKSYPRYDNPSQYWWELPKEYRHAHLQTLWEGWQLTRSAQPSPDAAQQAQGDADEAQSFLKWWQPYQLPEYWAVRPDLIAKHAWMARASYQAKAQDEPDAAQGGEVVQPVAYRYRGKDEEYRPWQYAQEGPMPMNAHRFEVEPLYTHPPADAVSSVQDEETREALKVALVYMGDALCDSDYAGDTPDEDVRNMWRTNSEALRKHIAALSRLASK